MTFKPFLLSASLIGLASTAFAQQSEPENLLPPEPEQVTEGLPDYTQLEARPSPPAPAAEAKPSVADSFGDIVMQPGEVVQEQAPLVADWSHGHVEALLAYIPSVTAEGLDPADYNASELQDLLAAKGPSEEVNLLASKIFVWLVEDLRDGRTPMDGRKQWFVMDPDADRTPSGRVLAQALESGDIAGTLASLLPTHPDYAALRDALADTPLEEAERRALIRANMDRWRWLPQELGTKYLITNVPEYQLRLTVKDRIVKTFRTVVGKPGRTATPQLAEMVEGVIFNPTWTVPQSIVKGEGLGAKVLGNPAWAKAQGYKATEGANGWVTVVQQPGPTNSLGLMKLDMPNRHAIFLHDTPSKHFFNNDARALSHGCIRVQNARELAMTMAILGNMEKREDIPVIQQEVTRITSGREYTAYPIKNQWPVYITYFTMARDVDGKLTTFKDIYGRDEAVKAAFKAPRVAERSRVQGEEIIPLEAPGA